MRAFARSRSRTLRYVYRICLCTFSFYDHFKFKRNETKRTEKKPGLTQFNSMIVSQSSALLNIVYTHTHRSTPPFSQCRFTQAKTRVRTAHMRECCGRQRTLFTHQCMSSWTAERGWGQLKCLVLIRETSRMKMCANFFVYPQKFYRWRDKTIFEPIRAVLIPEKCIDHSWIPTIFFPFDIKWREKKIQSKSQIQFPPQ